MPLCRTRYDKQKVVSVTCGHGLTQRQYQDECDVNRILMRYNVDLGGSPITPQEIRNVMEMASPPHVRSTAPRLPIFGDFYNAPDFVQAQEIINHAKECFQALPSRLRLKFGNDPAALMSWLDDPANRREAEEYGLVHRRVEVVDEKAAPKNSEPVEK